MSPNAELVRTFPQTSIKAPRKAGPSGAHVAWGLSPHATDYHKWAWLKCAAGEFVLHRGRIDVESCDEPRLWHAACSASTATLATGHGAASSGWR